MIPTYTSDGDKIYENKDFQLHRDDGPAVETANGNKEWYRNGLRHRIGGPAIELSGGGKAWYEYGKCHRLDGPAIEYTTGRKEYWINGAQIFPLFVEFDKIIKKIEKYGK